MGKPAQLLHNASVVTPRPALNGVISCTMDMGYVLPWREVLCAYALISAKKDFHILWLLLLLLLQVCVVEAIKI